MAGKNKKVDQKIIQKRVFIETLVEKKTIQDIRKRQKTIKGLKQDPSKSINIWGDKQLTPGCKEHCLKGNFAYIRTTTKCNLDCKFCYHHKQKDRQNRELIPPGYFLLSNRLVDDNDLKTLFKIKGKRHLTGVGWLHFEPLLELERMLPMMEFLMKKGYYQWLYTNGTLITHDNMKKLKDSGLNEIRVNLAATNCSDSVLKKMKIARQYIKTLCIESPVFTDYYESL